MPHRQGWSVKPWRLTAKDVPAISIAACGDLGGVCFVPLMGWNCQESFQRSRLRCSFNGVIKGTRSSAVPLFQAFKEQGKSYAAQLIREKTRY